MIAILLPCYNAAATLPETLASISAQTFGDYEVIAVDDGSTDETAALLANAAAHDRRVRPLLRPHTGLVAALNAGLAACQHPFIARMDADDLMHPTRLSRQVAALTADPALMLIASQVAIFPEATLRDGYREYLAWQNRILTPADLAAQIYVEAPFAHPSVMLRRSAVEQVGGYRQGDFPEDYELWLRMFAAGLPMAKLPEVLLHWRDSPERTSRRDPRYRRSAFDQLRADYLARDPRLHQGRPLAFWGAGRPTRLRAAHLIAKGFAPSAWIDIDPRKIGQSVAGVPVVARSWLANRTPRPFVLVYINSHGARNQIDGWLAELGYCPGEDYLGVG